MVKDCNLEKVINTCKPGRTFKALEMYKGIEVSVTEVGEETAEKDNVEDAVKEEHSEKEVQQENSEKDVKPETLNSELEEGKQHVTAEGFEIVRDADAPEMMDIRVKAEANSIISIFVFVFNAKGRILQRVTASSLLANYKVQRIEQSLSPAVQMTNVTQNSTVTMSAQIKAQTTSAATIILPNVGEFSWTNHIDWNRMILIVDPTPDFDSHMCMKNYYLLYNFELDFCVVTWHSLCAFTETLKGV